MSQSAVAVRPPMANLAAPSKNSRRLIPPCTYLWKRLSSCGSKSLAFFPFFLSIQLTPLGGLSSACRLAQPALKINLSLQARRARGVESVCHAADSLLFLRVAVASVVFPESVE